MRKYLFPLVLSGILLTTTGCEETVDPVLDAEQPFTLYGFFNPRSDTQAVRVFPIEGTLTAERPEALEAAVTSTDLLTGETVAWTDSVVQFSDGTWGHVAFRPMTVEYNHTYRFQVERSDGATSQVVVPVPGLVTTERLDPYTRRLPNRLREAPFHPIKWEGDARLIEIDVLYTFEVLNVGRTTMAVPYDGQQKKTDDGWIIEIDLGRDQEWMRSELLRTGFMEDGDAQLELNYMQMRAMVINGEWDPPGGTFDLELLVEPGAWTNVENGFGFVGGGYVEEIRVFPNDCHRQLAGFYIPEGNACRPEYEEN